MSLFTFNVNKNHIFFLLIFITYFLRQLFKEISALNINSNQNIEFCGYFKDYEHAMYINNETGNRELTTTIEDGSSFYIKYHYEDTYDVYISSFFLIHHKDDLDEDKNKILKKTYLEQYFKIFKK